MAPRRCGLFNSDQNILLVGEGDLSFALSLARKFGGRRITATTFNSQEFVETEYSKGRANIAELGRLGAAVITDIDATRLDELLTPTRWLRTPVDFASIDAVVFNFPHPGWLDEKARKGPGARWGLDVLLATSVMCFHSFPLLHHLS